MTPEERRAEFIRQVVDKAQPPTPEAMAELRRLLPPVPRLPDIRTDKAA
jgi:hypothetical protein